MNSLRIYINDYLPREIGKNYAMLHDAGLVHVFPHSGNITGAGEICDLDSVKGPAINCGDKKNYKKDYRRDFQYMLNRAGNTIHSVSRKNPLGIIFFTDPFMDKLVLSYIANRNNVSPLETFSIVGNPLIIDCAESGYAKDLYENTFDKLGLQYEFNLTQDIINGFFPSSNFEYTDQKTGEKIYTASITDLPEYLDPIIEKDFRQTFDKFITSSERKYGKKPVRTLIEIVKRYWFDNVVESLDDDVIKNGTIELGNLNLAEIANSW